MSRNQAINLNQFAAIAGLTVRRLNQLENEGKLVARTDSGGYDPAAVGGWLRARIAADFGVTQDGRVYNFEAERARKAFHDADLAEMEAAEKRGELIRADEVLKRWTDMLAALRTTLLALPGDIATVVAPPDRIAIAEAEARKIVHKALSEMANGMEPTE